MKILINRRGLTLIELMIAMVIGLIVMSGVMRAFFSMQSTSQGINQRSSMSINGRGAMYLIEENIRLIGFNPEADMNPRNIIETAGPGYLKFKRNKDFENSSGIKTVTIGLRKSDDPDRDGIANSGISRLLVDKIPAADHIAAMRFAYAFDEDEDGGIDVSNNGRVLWAFDSGGDGWLDTKLDTGGKGEIEKNSGKPMTGRVGLEKIRAVKVWLVVRSENPVKGSKGKRVFNLGGKEFVPENHDYAYALFTTAVRCRNMF